MIWRNFNLPTHVGRNRYVTAQSGGSQPSIIANNRLLLAASTGMLITTLATDRSVRRWISRRVLRSDSTRFKVRFVTQKGKVLANEYYRAEVEVRARAGSSLTDEKLAQAYGYIGLDYSRPFSWMGYLMDLLRSMFGLADKGLSGDEKEKRDMYLSQGNELTNEEVWTSEKRGIDPSETEYLARISKEEFDVTVRVRSADINHMIDLFRMDISLSNFRRSIESYREGVISFASKLKDSYFNVSDKKGNRVRVVEEHSLLKDNVPNIESALSPVVSDTIETERGDPKVRETVIDTQNFNVVLSTYEKINQARVVLRQKILAAGITDSSLIGSTAPTPGRDNDLEETLYGLRHVTNYDYINRLESLNSGMANLSHDPYLNAWILGNFLYESNDFSHFKKKLNRKLQAFLPADPRAKLFKRNHSTNTLSNYAVETYEAHLRFVLDFLAEFDYLRDWTDDDTDVNYLLGVLRDFYLKHANVVESYGTNVYSRDLTLLTGKERKVMDALQTVVDILDKGLFKGGVDLYRNVSSYENWFAANYWRAILEGYHYDVVQGNDVLTKEVSGQSDSQLIDTVRLVVNQESVNDLKRLLEVNSNARRNMKAQLQWTANAASMGRLGDELPALQDMRSNDSVDSQASIYNFFTDSMKRSTTDEREFIHMESQVTDLAKKYDLHHPDDDGKEEDRVIKRSDMPISKMEKFFDIETESKAILSVDENALDTIDENSDMV